MRQRALTLACKALTAQQNHKDQSHITRWEQHEPLRGSVCVTSALYGIWQRVHPVWSRPLSHGPMG